MKLTSPSMVIQVMGRSMGIHKRSAKTMMKSSIKGSVYEDEFDAVDAFECA